MELVLTRWRPCKSGRRRQLHIVVLKNPLRQPRLNHLWLPRKLQTILKDHIVVVDWALLKKEKFVACKSSASFYPPPLSMSVRHRCQHLPKHHIMLFIGSIDALRSLSWHGIPKELRPMTWKLLMVTGSFAVRHEYWHDRIICLRIASAGSRCLNANEWNILSRPLDISRQKWRSWPSMSVSCAIRYT